MSAARRSGVSAEKSRPSRFAATNRACFEPVAPRLAQAARAEARLSCQEGDKLAGAAPVVRAQLGVDMRRPIRAAAAGVGSYGAAPATRRRFALTLRARDGGKRSSRSESDSSKVALQFSPKVEGHNRRAPFLTHLSQPRRHRATKPRTIVYFFVAFNRTTPKCAGKPHFRRTF